MFRKTLFAALLFAAACGPATTEPQPARPAGAVHDDAPPPPPADTTKRGGGTIGSGT
ncbi:MAG TPA: hypothetical protein VGC13_05040 [Longimicrobium sp.]|jgi:hypothetical protein|uniref:hypothetical protein n=1 Tax=Longimicrobium sp. TaxID=2029185 RepID=UPI002EDAACAD